MNTLPYEEVKAKIEDANSITILSHLNPDADALGTSLGIYNLLQTQYRDKRIEIVNFSKALPRYLDFLPNFHRIKHQIDYDDSLVITCDSGSIDRLGFDLEGREIINIDHHQSNTMYGLINVVVPEFASSSQVAFKLFKAFYPIDSHTATCFYTALISDTQYFTTNSVNDEVFGVAQALVSSGANPASISKNLTQRRSLAAFRILQSALSSLSLHQEAKIASLYVTKEDIKRAGATVPDLEGIVDFGRSLATVEIAICVMELEGSIRVSLRSKAADVSHVARHFGGGGHKVASGFTIYDENYSHIQECIDIIVKKIVELELIDET